MPRIGRLLARWGITTMAGSNGSPAQRGGPPPQWPTESDEQARALEIERWHQQQAQQRAHQQAHAHQTGGHGAAYGQPPFEPAHGGQGYTQLHNADTPFGGGRGLGHGAYADPASGPPVANPFAPQFERYAPPAPGPQRDLHGRYDPHGLPGHQAHPSHYDPQPPPEPELRGGFDPHRQPPAYDPRGFGGHQHGHQHAQPQQAGGHDARHHDPQSWDLSHYQPGQIPQGYGGQNGYAEPTHDPRAQASWQPQHGGGADQHWQQPAQAPGQWAHPDDPHGQQGYAQHAPGAYAQHQVDPSFDPRGGPHDQGLDVDDLEAAEEPRRGPSTLLVVGMLVGAIVVGGGMAFAYKQFAGGGGDKAKIAELKRPSSPEKVKPKDPGGKTMEHSDKKFLNRLAADAPADTQRQSDVDGAAKKVSTIPIVVNRDGSLTPQAPQPAAGESGVPGLVLDGFGPPPVPASAPQLRTDAGPVPVGAQASRIPPPPPPAARPAPAPPKVAELPLPKVISQQPAAPAVDKAPAPPRKQKAAARDDLIAQQAGSTGATEDAPSGLGSAAAPPRKPVAAASSSGYVAVLASKKSRQEALNYFADLHSQYQDVLGGMTPDVREANLGDKGMWYRLIVGPPGSREAARNVCVKLKDKGFKDCWPVAY